MIPRRFVGPETGQCKRDTTPGAQQGPASIKCPRWSYYNRGLAYALKGEYDHAIADYNQALALNPRYAETYSNRGAAYYREGNISKACADLRRACDLGECRSYNIRRSEGSCR
jgi:tetratricopeptide (TPR) repeat protein